MGVSDVMPRIRKGIASEDRYEAIEVLSSQKSPEERKRLREEILQERRDAFNVLAKY